MLPRRRRADLRPGDITQESIDAVDEAAATLV